MSRRPSLRTVLLGGMYLIGAILAGLILSSLVNLTGEVRDTQQEADARGQQRAALAEDVNVLRDQLLRLGEVPLTGPPQEVREGPRGPTGETGLAGRPGEPGADGTAFIGPPGPAGPPGSTGSPGSSGSPGPSAEDGTDGLSGQDGASGSAGADGQHGSARRRR